MTKKDTYIDRQFLVINTIAWLLIFALTVSESIFYYQVNQRPIPYKNILVNDLFILCWIPITPGLYVLIRKWYSQKTAWANFGFKLFLAGVMVLALILTMETTIHYLDRLGGPQERSWSNLYVQLISFRFHSNLVLFLGFSAISVAATAYAESKKHAKNEAELKKNLVEAQLGVLKAQMKPHFLFNSLHAISGLILKKENDLAISVIAKLSDLLRDSLNMDGKKWITLAEELDFLERYLEIYRMRFGKQLTHKFVMAEDTDALAVPPLLLQPLVENSLVHGIIPNDNQGHIEVRTRREKAGLVIEVMDDSPINNGKQKSTKEGVGLGNTRKRLYSLYGENFELIFESNTNSAGASTRVRLPLIEQH